MSASDAINVPRLRALRLAVADARNDALGAAWHRSRRIRRAYAAALRERLSQIDAELAAIESAAFEQPEPEKKVTAP